MSSRRSQSALIDAPFPASVSHWFLREKAESGFSNRTVNVNSSPFRIGRLPDLELWLPHNGVSKRHAELIADDRRLLLRDLGSTNGTFVNGQRVTEAVELRHGDMLQFANIVFRLDYRDLDPCLQTIQEGAVEWVNTLCRFERLMAERLVSAEFQPIVRLSDGARISFEVLGRSTLDGLKTPDAMFAAAAHLDQQSALSRLLRWEGVRVGGGLPGGLSLFVNTHPSEIITEELAISLRDLRRSFPRQRLTLEIHEAAVTDIDSLIQFRALLRDLEVDLAFDDFGAGQPRLIELTETSPDVVKFDINLIRDIHLAPPRRQTMLASFVRLVRDLGIATLAEGIEVAEEAAVCRELGFELAQGYHFGRPAPLEHWTLTDHP